MNHSINPIYGVASYPKLDTGVCSFDLGREKYCTNRVEVTTSKVRVMKYKDHWL